MSLLMDALKKAELAKRQGSANAEVATGDTEHGATTGSLSLSPIELKPIEATSLDLTFPAANPISPRRDAPLEQRLPELPTELGDLDAQFETASLRHPPASRSNQPPPPAPEIQDAVVTAQAAPRPVAAPAVAPASVSASAHAAAKPATLKPAPAKPAAAAAAAAGQTSAQNLFAAKTPDKPAANKRAFAIAMGALTLVSVLAIGGYFWWQLQPKSPPPALRAAPPPAVVPATPAAVSAPPSLPASSPAVPPAPTSTAALPVRPRASVQQAQQADDSDDDEETTRPAERTRPGAPVATTRAAKAGAAIPAAAVGGGDAVTVTRQALRVNPGIARGYALFESGDLGAARGEYERVTVAEPHNTDALHGLAAIALREARLDDAEAEYRRLLVADPQDALALSALANLRGASNPTAVENRLRGLAAAQPELAAPQFALGNLYAAQARWADAQQAYFRAYSAEPGNPDILFNLAVSLEHLRQNRLAAQYYAQAVAAAERRPAGFDPAQAAQRRRALEAER